MDKHVVLSVLQIIVGAVVIVLCCYSLYDVLAGKDSYSVCTQSCNYTFNDSVCSETCHHVNVTCKFIDLIMRVCTPDVDISGVSV